MNLIYVADFTKVSGGGLDQSTEVGADTGLINRNVYLYCASEGLATVVRALIDRDGQRVKLRPERNYPGAIRGLSKRIARRRFSNEVEQGSLPKREVEAGSRSHLPRQTVSVTVRSVLFR